ncbi:serine family amino acid catabolism-related protein [Metarhizium album ARSEF 1941]|uniref:L-serine ammonia-lyase n=1 Tax=Metarhizium album (strain ARSEF 1941) TaxID=1081103 RepID=A0A0B2WW64_METAS|nr:serine family amino acid catabolism-related protein [Metarhizium album ARSEF 1941]KHO00432.1 serine family amino acid catabolism-related protein [Metarhizium album ARSEF 1941]
MTVKTASHAKIPWIETPLVRSAALSAAAGCNVFLKLENLQPAGSFKSRGIGNYLVCQLAAAQAAGTRAGSRPHFYCSSGGNAGLACVHGAITLGCEATIVVPLSTTPYMVGRLREAGATEVIQQGASWQEADHYLTEALMRDARARGETAVYVPPFDAQQIWDGNAGITREIVRQLPSAERHYATSDAAEDGDADLGVSAPRVDAIVCSVGGGGLLAGIVQGLDELKLEKTTVIAVETDGADSLSRALSGGELVTLPAITSLATSLGARRVCQRAFEYGMRDTVASLVLPDSEAISACRRFLDEERLLVELACGVCPAVCYSGQLEKLVPGFSANSVVVLIICGGSNISLEMMDRYPSEQAS